MNTQLPVPERTLPAESAYRIRTALLVDELELGDRRRSTWLLPLAAVLVVVALLAVAAVLWPRTSKTEVARTPTPIQLTWTPTTVVNSRPPFYKPPVPFSRAPATPTTGPTSGSDIFRTDRGPLSAEEESIALAFCEGDAGGNGDGAEALYARRLTSGQEDMNIVIFRGASGEEWICIPDALLVPLDPVDPSVGPNATNPVVAAGGTVSGDRDGTTQEWLIRTLPSVVRVQVRAVVKDKPRPWFEAEVHGGFAYLPIYTAGKFPWPKKADHPSGISYEQRAFDAEGREVSVKVVKPSR